MLGFIRRGRNGLFGWFVVALTISVRGRHVRTRPRAEQTVAIRVEVGRTRLIAPIAQIVCVDFDTRGPGVVGADEGIAIDDSYGVRGRAVAVVTVRSAPVERVHQLVVVDEHRVRRIDVVEVLPRRMPRRDINFPRA